MLKSIQTRIVIIYLLLILVAMLVVGVFITEQLRTYFEGEILEELKGKSEGIAYQVLRYNWNDIPETEKLLVSYSIGSADEIYILDDSGFIITGNFESATEGYKLGKGGDYLQKDVILRGLAGIETAEIVKINSLRYQDYVRPVEHLGQRRLIYIRSSLKVLDDNLSRVSRIITSATLLALISTGLLGLILSRSISGPIKDVTEKASLMARGDFNQVVTVRSDDEIGQLGKMFNVLTRELKYNLGIISNEKSKMESIINHMADGLLAIKVDGSIIEANPAAKNLLDLDGEVVGRKVEEVFADREYYKDLVKLLALEDNEAKDKKAFVINQGSSVLNINKAIFKDEDGENGVIMVIQDATEQTKLENMRRQFVANVSHELRTPLTSIKSYAETLLDGAMEDQETAVNFLSVINSESDRMTRLVKDLLELSRLEHQQISLTMGEVSPYVVVKESVEKLKIASKEKDIELLMNVERDVPNIVGDKDRLVQVLINVISNSIKYTQPKGRVDVYLELVDSKVRIRVKDNGMGIPKEDLPRIFERFYRVDKARSRELGGTGLGLSISKEIVEAHGGSISIESELGKGTTISIDLDVKIS